ncbi:MAG: hypothetical protein H0V24_04205 [Chloroflexia bacterium]|nr:hypothetical protein [Chloroflexia bacterium]
MDGTPFDQWIKRIAAPTSSRRGLLRLGVGSGFAALIFGTAAEKALACRKNGKPCDKGKRNGNCCSGTCRNGKCRPTPGALGCTVNGGDFCQGQHIACPQNPGGICVLLDTGKPFCVEEGHCLPCTANADCTFRPNGKCLKTCPFCDGDNNQGCFYPRA